MVNLSSKISKPDTWTTSSKAVDVPDIALWIYSFIEDNRDRASFSAIRREVYHVLLEYRLKNAVVRVDHLLSFALVLQGHSEASKSCNSLKIIDLPVGVSPAPGIFDVNEAFSFYCTAAILKAIGEDGSLKHFSGYTVGWFPAAEIHQKKMALQDRHRKHLNAAFGDVKASKEELKAALNTLDGACDQLATDLSKRVSDAGLSGTVEDFKSTTAALHELQKSAASLEEMHVVFTIDIWRALCDGRFPALRRLGLNTASSTVNIRIGFQKPLLENPVPLDAFERLETLKLVIHSQDSPTQLLSIRCPRLKNFEIGGAGGGGDDREASLSAVENFIQCHPTLEAISLANHFVSANVKGPPKLFAVQHMYAKNIRSPKVGKAMCLSSVRHARAIFSSEAPFYLTPLNEGDMRHIRCLELSFRSFEDSRYMLERIEDSDTDSDSESSNLTPLNRRVSETVSVFSELVELGIHLHIPNHSLIDIPRGREIISQILEGCRDCKSILAVRFRNTGPDICLDGPVTTFEIPIAPPNLRFISLEVETEVTLYEVNTQSNGDGRIAVQRPPRRTLPAEGKWTIDWTDESVYDHFTGDYSDSQI